MDDATNGTNRPLRDRKRLRRWIRRSLIALVVVPVIAVALAIGSLFLPPVQRALGNRVASALSKKTGAKVELERLRLSIPLRVTLSDLHVEERDGDTLLFAERIDARIGMRALFNGCLRFESAELTGIRARLHQAEDSTFNFDFIVNAFTSPQQERLETDTSRGLVIDARSVHLERIRFDMDLEPSDLGMSVWLGELDVTLDTFDLDPMRFHVNELALRGSRVSLRTAAGTPEPTSYPALHNPLENIDIAFRTLALDSVRFDLTDESGDSLWMAIERGRLKGRSMDHRQQTVALSSVDLAGFQFGSLSRSGEDHLDTLPGDPPWLDRNDGFRYWTRDWDLSIDTLTIARSGFAMHTDSIPGIRGAFDPAHLVITDVDMAARAIEVHNDGTAMQLDRAALRTDAIHGPLKVAMGMRADPRSLTIEHGELHDDGNSITWDASITTGDLSRMHRDPMNIPFAINASFDMRQDGLRAMLDRFNALPGEWPVIDERWRADLEVRGTMRRMENATLALNGGGGSRVQMSAGIDDLADILRSAYHLEVNELVLGPGLSALAHAYAPHGTRLPARLNMRATARGARGSHSAEVNLASDLGNINGTGSVSGWNGRIPDALVLDIVASDIATSRLMVDTAFGRMDFTLKADGRQLNDPSRSGSLSFKPSRFTFHGNDLSSLNAGATIAGDSVHGTMRCASPVLDLELDAVSSWPDEEEGIAARWDLLLNALHLDELGLLDHVLRASGRFTGDLTTTDALHGRFNLEGTGLRFFDLEREHPIATLKASGLLHADSSALHLDCDAMRVSFTANVPLDSLAGLVHERWTALLDPAHARNAPTHGRADLNVELPGTERLASLLLPGMRAMQVDRFDVHYNGPSDEWRADIAVPLLDYDGVVVRNMRSELRSSGPDLQASLHIQRVERDSLHMDDLSLEASDTPGGIAMLLRLREGEADRYRIGGEVGNDAGTTVLRLQEQLTLDRRHWTVDAKNEIRLSAGGARARDLVLHSGDERAEWRTTDRGHALRFEHFDLANITGLVRSADSLAFVRGRLDASLRLPPDAVGRLDAQVRLTELTVLDAELGVVEGHIEETRADRYKGGFTMTSGANHVRTAFTVDLTLTQPSRFSATTDLDLGDLSVLEPFVRGILFELNGGSKGTVVLDRTGDAFAVTGRAVITDGTIGLVQTGATYRVPHDTISFDDHRITVNGFDVLDADSNLFRLDGHVSAEDARSMVLDLRLRTDRFQLVNSTADDNPMFYGRLFNSIDLHIGGSSIAPVVKGDLGVLDSTVLSVVLPGSKVALVDHEGIVQFTTGIDAQDSAIQRSNSELLRDSLAAQLPGIVLDLRVRLDPHARFAVVLDPTTGDQATFSGDADLVFRYDPEGDVYLQGPFTVTDGGYTLEFYGLVKKRFDLVPGGRIVWDGDPLGGRMDVQAKFSTTAAPYPLVANARGGLTESERNTLQARLPFDVLINFKDAVRAPTISFGLDMDRQVRNSYPQVNSVLDQLEKPASQEELNRQVFGLLVLNTFIENESGTEQGGSSLATTAARNSVNSILTQQLNKVTGNRIKGMDIQLGVNTYDQTEGGENYARTTLDYKVTQRLLNDRVSIEAGGSIGADEKRQDVSGVSNTRAPQYAIAYDITKDGRLRLRVFHENAYDLYDGELVNNGVAIMLTRDFEAQQRKRERRRQEILRQRGAGTSTPEEK